MRIGHGLLALLALALPALAATPPRTHPGLMGIGTIRYGCPSARQASSPLRAPRTLSSQVESGPAGRSVPGIAVHASSNPSPSRSASSASSAVKTLARLPLAFEANRGQTDGRVRYLSRGMGYTLFLTGTEAVVALGGPTPRPEGRVCLGGKARKRACTIAAHCVGARELRPALKDGSAPGGKARERACTTHGDGSRLEAASPMGQTRRLRRGAERRGAGSPLATSSLLHLRLVGADPHARIAGEAPLPGRSHYLRGSDPAKWRTNVPQYAKVRAQQVYPGIDAVYYGNREGRLEYDFEVAPGADPNRIRLAFSGARKVELAANGDLLLRTAAGTLRQHRPVAYQEINGQRRYVSARYRLQHRKSANPQSAIRNPQSAIGSPEVGRP